MGDIVHESGLFTFLYCGDASSTVTLSPSRDRLHEARFRGSNFLKLFLKFFPNTRNCEEQSGASPGKCLHNSALESVRASKINFMTGQVVGQNIH